MDSKEYSSHMLKKIALKVLTVTDMPLPWDHSIVLTGADHAHLSSRNVEASQTEVSTKHHQNSLKAVSITNFILTVHNPLKLYTVVSSYVDSPLILFNLLLGLDCSLYPAAKLK